VRQQVVERPARLERSGVLEQLELERETAGPQSEIRGVHVHDRRAPDVRLDALVRLANLVLGQVSSMPRLIINRESP
jgi:hypothetical protein